MTTLEELNAEPDEMPARKALYSDEKQPGKEFVDRIEGDLAVLIKHGDGDGDDYETHDVPVSSLPKGTKQGDWVSTGNPLYQDEGRDDKAGAAASIINSLYAMPR
jgi:hypothetical protein